jgi:hypothetical protein
MKFLDYILIRTPEQRLGEDDKARNVRKAEPGAVSRSRLIFSFIGLLVGVVASFYVINLVSNVDTGQPSQPRVSTQDLSWARFAVVGIISMVICSLTYPGLYYSLRLYDNEPTWLVLFVSFQYGYFWRSIIEGVSALG